MYAVINWVAKYESNLSPIPLNPFIQATLLKLAAIYLRKDYTSKRIYGANSCGYHSIIKN
jgi:hypothetical protein